MLQGDTANCSSAQCAPLRVVSFQFVRYTLDTPLAMRVSVLKGAGFLHSTSAEPNEGALKSMSSEARLTAADQLAPDRLPEVGELVHVRSRKYLVEELALPPESVDSPLVRAPFLCGGRRGWASPSRCSGTRKSTPSSSTGRTGRPSSAGVSTSPECS